MEAENLADRKAATRAKLKQIRASIAAEIRSRRSQAIQEKIINLPEIRDAQSIFIFISYGNEVDTHGLLRYFLDQGKILAVPKILPEKTMIAVPFRRWEDLSRGELGILTPTENSPYPGEIDVVITPGLGFTPAGHRIGYGRGYYDKWFAAHGHGQKIAVAFEDQIIDALPVGSTDVPVDVIVTEKRIIRTGM